MAYVHVSSYQDVLSLLHSVAHYKRRDFMAFGAWTLRVLFNLMIKYLDRYCKVTRTELRDNFASLKICTIPSPELRIPGLQGAAGMVVGVI